MALTWAPFAPWHGYVTAAGVLVIVLTLAAWITGRMQSWSYRKAPRWVIFTMTLLATSCLILAVWNPQFAHAQTGQPFQLAVVFDVSASVRGGEGGWQKGRDLVETRVKAWLRSMPESLQAAGTAGIFTLQDQSTLTTVRHPISELGNRLRGMDESRFASGQESHLADGLKRANQWLREGKGQGVILLVTDGFQTRGDVLAEANRLAQQGIPVHVITTEGSGPDLDWVAVDLPRQIGATQPTFLRAMIRNGRDTAAKASLSLTLNGGVDALSESGSSESQTVDVEAGGWRRLRWPVQFRGTGIQYADLVMTSGESFGRTRRFFSYVQQPARILLVGGDFRVADALPADQVLVDMVPPHETEQALLSNHYDGVVLSGVTAGDIGSEGLRRIAWMVEKEGLGLFVINGGHRDFGSETETILMSYNDTVIEDLLPLSSRPRPYTPEAPGRHVVVVIDASGSMKGWRIRKSQEIVSHIIENHLRPRDRLFLISFSTGARVLVENRYMDPTGKTEALQALYGMKTGGGTDPSLALDLLGRRRLHNCGLIFLSDGEFDQVSYRPDCRATVFALGTETVSDSSPLWDIADPFPVTQEFHPDAIEMPYFEQKTRNRFFERGRFTPMSMDMFLARSDRLPMPSKSLQGSAVTFAKDDATLIAVRPKLTDPVLAYAIRGLGEVGVFTSGIDDLWLRDELGREAVSAWILRTLGFTARDRYQFKVKDLGHALELEVSLVMQGGILPVISQLHGEIIHTQGTSPSVSFLPDPETPGTFRGRIRLDDMKQPTRAKLVLREAGPEAVARTQAVPMFLPEASETTAAVTAERFSSGTHVALLAAITEQTGGILNPGTGSLIFPQTPRRPPQNHLWPWLIVLAVLFHLIAIGFQRLAE